MNKRNRISEKNDLNKCLRCGSACCRYITVSIPAPRSMLDFDNLRWQLYHREIRAFKDRDGWHLLIENPCLQLTRSGRCGIYEQRPAACREHPVEDCEFGNPVSAWAELFFDGAGALDEYCRKRFRNWGRGITVRESGDGDASML